MKVLVACEESQTVCKAFRELGHEAYSCDIQECSGGHPEWHIKADVLQLLSPSLQFQGLSSEYYGIAPFATMDREIHFVTGKWDLIIAHPPCTYLTAAGNRWFNVERYGEKAIRRYKDRADAAKFFMCFANADCFCIAIENPIGHMSTAWRRPDQIIHPYMFGDPARKATCLWLKGLPKLEPTNIVVPTIIKYKNGKGTDNPWHMETMKLPQADRAKARSKTFPGIAKAMAEQWGGDIRQEVFYENYVR